MIERAEPLPVTWWFKEFLQKAAHPETDQESQPEDHTTDKILPTVDIKESQEQQPPMQTDDHAADDAISRESGSEAVRNESGAKEKPDRKAARAKKVRKSK